VARASIPLHFVFQGGGAKLGALIAVAEEIFDQAKPLGYRIATVSGTSAGAIAACVLATGKSPGLFRKQIQALAPAHLPKIVTDYSFTRQIWRAYWGTALYNAKAYSTFLGTLFQTACAPASYVHISDLDPSIDLFIHAADLRVREPVIYRRGDAGFNEMTIADALLASSSIPFIFNTYADGRYVVDGGLVDNFPSDTVTNIVAAIESVHEQGYVVGISFEPARIEWEFPDAYSYVSALIATVIDCPVQRSIKKLDKEDVHFISTETTTFDFQRALDIDLADKQYNDYRADMKKFLRALVTRKRLQNATLGSNVIIDRIKTLHENYSSKQRVTIKKTVIKVTCHCLKLPNVEEIKSSQIYDEFDIMNEIEVKDDQVYTIGLSLVMDASVLAIGDVNVNVAAPDGANVDTTIIPLTPKAVGEDIETTTLLIFFHEPLKKPGLYRLELRSRLREVLFNLLADEARDSIWYKNVNHDLVETLEILAYLPNTVTKPALVDLGKTEDRLERVKWREGREMTKVEIGRYGPAPGGFQSIGWTVNGLSRGDAAGFQVRG
jgi:patatin-like phospholipase